MAEAGVSSREASSNDLATFGGVALAIHTYLHLVGPNSRFGALCVLTSTFFVLEVVVVVVALASETRPLSRIGRVVVVFMAAPRP